VLVDSDTSLESSSLETGVKTVRLGECDVVENEVKWMLDGS